MSSVATFQRGLYKSTFGRGLLRWLDATPHPLLAIEIALDRVSGARWSRGGALEAYAVDALPPGALVPSAVEQNVVNVPALKAAVAGVCSRLSAKGESVALILPDPVIRVFVQHFDEFPRSQSEAEPMLRWKLKKSVPFEVDETVISYFRQPPREAGVDVVTALARTKIVREYESLVESVGLHPGVVLNSSLAAVALLTDARPTLLARISGTALTTVIVRDGVLCGYRCTELPARGTDLTPHMLLEDVFPVAAYYQDTWQEGIQSVRIAGLGARLPEFVPPLEGEFHCEVRSLVHNAMSDGRIPADARPLAERELDGLIGWMMHRN